jgi:hypothetical protein
MFNKSLKNELWNIMVAPHAHFIHSIVERSRNVSLLTGCTLAKALTRTQSLIAI